jgi:alpha-beta hydrolase superfamily lysophospholipase
MKTFIKLLDAPCAKLLYIMGATWHNQCMFDLKTSEPSFASLLNDKGIETYTFDIAGTGPDKKTNVIGDCHQNNINYALELINTYQIEYVLGYSYGSLVISDMIDQLPACVKGIILLDPYAVLTPVNVTMLDAGDKKLVKRVQVADDLVRYNCNVSTEIKEAYLTALTNDADDLVTASYPGKRMKANFAKFSSEENISNLCKVKLTAFFTSTSNKTVREKFPESVCVFWTDSSHWILLEPKRFELADAVEKFIKN